MTRRSCFLTLAAPLLAQDANLLPALLKRHRPRPRRFAFAAIGDQQYGEVGIRKWPALQQSINQTTGLRFAVHVGDIKSGSSSCEDAMFASRRQDFDRFNIPFILTPGDNEWTDCHRPDAGGFDSLNRLDLLRKTFYPDARSLGRRSLVLSRQSEDPRFARFVENTIWSEGNVLFAALHIVGSNNNLGRNPANDAEWRERTQANAQWIQTIFAVAKQNRFAGLVLISHANPGFRGPRVRPAQLLAGIKDSYSLLADQIHQWAKPVLLIHGDSHQFRLDKPLLVQSSGKLLDNFTRLEVPGSADVHWVKVLVDPTQSQLFGFEHRDVPANYETQ